MLDRATATWPDFNAIIGTCRRPLKQTEVDLCFTSFAPLLEVFEEDDPGNFNFEISSLGS